VLTEEHEILVAHTLKQPSLLSTCQRIRKEALSLWYKCNKFSVAITDCDATLLVAFSAHVMTLRQGKHTSLSIQINGRKDWTNMMRWCQAVWRVKCSVLLREEDGDEQGTVISLAHDIAFGHLGRPLAECKRALQNLGHVVKKFDDEWEDAREAGDNEDGGDGD